MSRYGIDRWGAFRWGPAFPGWCCVVVAVAASCSVDLAALNSLEVRVMPISALKSNVLAFTLKFRNAAGQFADPDTVTLRLLQPSGEEYSPAPAPNKIATGVWRAEFDTAGLAAGVWTYRAEGHGLVDTAAEGTFEVLGSAFD